MDKDLPLPPQDFVKQSIKQTFFPREECSSSQYFGVYATAAVLPILYVASLYVWERKQVSTHPETIKRRFISVGIVTAFAPFFVKYFVHPDLLKDHELIELLGFRLNGIFQAICIPFCLTWILFLGPISIEFYSGLIRIYLQPTYWISSMKQILWVRNYVIAPITEEIVFRACVLTLILHCTTPSKAVFICPLFFGAAHLHHMSEQIRLGMQWKIALIGSCIQFMYTSIFGAYSAFLFLRTGHLISPIIIHSFCNHMGLPDFGSLSEMPNKKKWVSISCFAGGIIGWLLLLHPLTDPKIYGNNLPWSAVI